MWVALSMLLLFVGYCWLDSLKSPFLLGSEWSSASDDEAEEQTGLTETIDDSVQTKREEYQAWHDMGFMTPDHVIPTDLAPEKRSSWLMMESETGAMR